MRYVHDALSGDENLALSLSASTRFHVVVGGGGGFVCVCVCVGFRVCVCWISLYVLCGSGVVLPRTHFAPGGTGLTPLRHHELCTDFYCDGLLHHSVRAELESATPSAK